MRQRGYPVIGVTALILAGTLASCATHSTGGRGAPTPSASAGYAAAAHLTGPVTAGVLVEPLAAVPVRLPARYTEREFFASGTAVAFRPTSTPADGRWTVTPTTQARYRTRILVRAPRDPRQFNGTVVVEWLNVSSGEASPDWDYLNPLLIRAGYAYVAVSAQALGVEGGSSLLRPGASQGLVATEPRRYGSLHHPGDAYAYDIFAQVGAAIRSDADTVLAGLHPRHVVAVGESQSAFFLTTFTDAVEPLTRTFDGLFIHSRAGGGAPLSGDLDAAAATTGDQRIRTDLGVPVFMFETETDVSRLGFSRARQPDTARIRTWEVAGTAHADAYLVGPYARLLGCTAPINAGPQHVVVQAAFAAFDDWVARGIAPPKPRPLAVRAGAPTLERDATGNAIGGVRTPAVDVPVATLSGEAPLGASIVCSLFGSTVPFGPARLAELYGSRSAYLSRYTRKLDAAVGAGFILPTDRGPLLREARAVRFP